MKVGDLVIRKIHPTSGPRALALEQRQRLGHGLVLAKQISGKNPAHPCITVFYPKTGQTYDIAESLMEVVSEGR